VIGLEIINKTKLKTKKKVSTILSVPKYWLLSSKIVDDAFLIKILSAETSTTKETSPNPSAISHCNCPLVAYSVWLQLVLFPKIVDWFTKD